MSEFIYAGGSIPSKSNLTALPGGADATKWLQATDWATLRSALYDTRSAVLAGQLHGFTAQASRPAVSGADRFLWVDTDDHLQYFDGSSDLDISGANTLQGAYDNGDGTLAVDASGTKPFAVLAGAAPAGTVLFDAGGGALQVVKADPTYALPAANQAVDYVRISRLLGVDSGDGNTPSTQIIYLAGDADTHILGATSRTIEGGRLWLRGGTGVAAGEHDGQDRHFGGDVVILGGAPGAGSTDRGGQVVIDAHPTNVQGSIVSPIDGIGVWTFAATQSDQTDVDIGSNYALLVRVGRLTTTANSGLHLFGGINGVQLTGVGAVRLSHGYGTITGVDFLTKINDETTLYGTSTGNVQGAFWRANQLGLTGNATGTGAMHLQVGSVDRIVLANDNTVTVQNTVGSLVFNAFGTLYNVATGTMNIGRASVYRFTIDSSNVAAINGLIATMSFTSTIGASLVATAQTSGNPNLLTLTGAAHTGITATAECTLSYHDFGQTYTWATGAVASQRFFRIAAPTIAAAAASTFTQAYSASIAAPVAGSFATLTHAAALNLTATVVGTRCAILDKTMSAANSNYYLSLRRNVSTAVAELYADASDIFHLDATAGFKFLYNTQPLVYADGTNGLVLTYPGQGQIQFAFSGIYSTFFAPALNNTYDHGSSSLKWATSYTAKHRITDVAGTSGTPQALVLTGAAHTGLTTTAEVTQVDLDLGQTYTWAAGTVALQRFARLRRPTVAFASASTVTKTSLLYLDGQPQQGTNATLTASWALYVDQQSGDTVYPGGAALFNGVVNVGKFANLGNYAPLQVRSADDSWPLAIIDCGAHTGGVGGDFGGGTPIAQKALSVQRVSTEKFYLELDASDVLGVKSGSGDTHVSFGGSGGGPKLSFFGGTTRVQDGTTFTLNSGTASHDLPSGATLVQVEQFARQLAKTLGGTSGLNLFASDA